MTDQDAAFIRTIIAKYGMTKGLRELIQILSVWSTQRPCWCPVESALRRAVFVSSGAIKKVKV
jgi:hypothetical protein